MIALDANSVRDQVVGATAPLRVVVCGEIGSGKSSVIGALLRQDLTQLTDADQPAIRVTYAEQAKVVGVFDDGEIVTQDSLNGARLPQEIAAVEINSSSAHIQGLEISEVPVSRDGEISEQGMARLAKADVFIWVTVAFQAWRLSEKEIVDRIFKAGRPETTLLMVSRGDKLRSASDRDRVADRMQRETEEYFQSVAFLHGAAATVQASSASEEAWATTGGKALYELLSPLKMPDPMPVAVEMPPAEPLDGAGQGHPSVQTDYENVVLFKSARNITETMHGLVSAGVVSTSNPSKPLHIFGEKEICERTAQFCSEYFKGEIRRLDAATGMTSVTGLQFTMKEHLLICEKSEAANALIFILCDIELMNAGIARIAFTRIQKEFEASFALANKETVSGGT